MALTTTTLNGTVTATVSQIKLTAFTAPSGRNPKTLLRLDDEICLITDTTLSPTLSVVRGYMGTSAAAHTSGVGVTYGVPADFQTSKGPSTSFPSLANPTLFSNVQEITATGTTGSDAAIITQPSPAFINSTGATDAGVNLPVPIVGMYYTIRNASTTGAVKIYCVGGTINGTTGTTAVSMTHTGTKMATAFCSTAGAWQLAGSA